MAKRYAIWDKVSDIYTPVGEKLTAEQWIARYGWINAAGAVPVVAAGLINGALIDELGQMKTRCEQMGATFDEGLNNQQLLDAIEAWEDEQRSKPAETDPTAEERIAAALEYQNLLSL